MYYHGFCGLSVSTSWCILGVFLSFFLFYFDLILCYSNYNVLLSLCLYGEDVAGGEVGGDV